MVITFGVGGLHGKKKREVAIRSGGRTIQCKKRQAHISCLTDGTRVGEPAHSKFTVSCILRTHKQFRNLDNGRTGEVSVRIT